MQSPTCATCPFFRPTDIEQHGTCHVEPPKGGSSGFGYWPKVAYWGFCSEHPHAPRTRIHDLLALIAYRLESNDERAQRSMQVPQDRPF